MANRRNRIIYASQSVHAEGRILYRVRTFGSSSTFNTTDIFQLGQLNLTDIIDDSPEVAVTLEGYDYGSIYTMATLAKVPTSNLHHNIRQSDGTTFFGTVSGNDVSNGELSPLLPSTSGTGRANLVVKDGIGGSTLAYLHGVQLIDFGRECGVSKGVSIWSPIQSECSLGSAANDIEFTKLVNDVFINRIDLTYQATDMSNENYTGETEQKQWFLNSARFLSWEEWHCGVLTGEITPITLGAKNGLKLSLPTPNNVALLEDKNIAFLKKDLVGRPAILFTFTRGGGLTNPESKAIPVFSNTSCIPSNVVEYFIYDSATNQVNYFENGLASTLVNVLPAGRSAFINGDKVFVLYAANAYAEEVGSLTRPIGADATYVAAKYFAPISTNDVEDIGGIRQGQVEAYLVDPDLILKTELTGATITSNSFTFNNTVPSQVDLTRFVGLKVNVVDGPGKNGPAREILSATNNLVGNYNNGSIILGGSTWASIRLLESSTQSSTDQLIYVDKLCGIDNSYAGADISVVVSGSPELAVISGVNTANNLITLTNASILSDVADNGAEILVSVEPTVDSTIVVGDYNLALRLQSVNISADLTREQLKEIGHLNPYARTITLPIRFTAGIETTGSDLETFATFAGKLNKFNTNTLTDVDIVDLLAKDNLAIVVMIYQQTDQEAGGTGIDRKVLSPEMFGDEYFVNGVRNVYDKIDGSLREYPLKTVIVQNLRITDENISTPIDGNATQSFNFRGTNELTAVRGYVSVELATKTIESQGE